MRLLVTGGAGFIGSNFVRRSLDGDYPATRGAAITVLDSLSYAGNTANLAAHRDDPRLRFLRGDVRDPQAVRAALEGVDAVLHFAAESHVDRSIQDSGTFVETNVNGTHVLLAASLEAGVDRFVLISTDEVYGSIGSGEWTEQSPVAPNSPYSASKAGAEHMARAYHHTHGLPVGIVRACNNFGPFQHPEKLIPLFTTNLLDGRTVPLYGSGSHIREWQHVDDHCRGIALVLEKGRAGAVYNIGSGQRVANKDLAQRLIALLGASAQSIRTVEDRKGHDARYALDSGKALRELGFRPRIPLDEGLADTVRWYTAHREWWAPLRRADAVPSPAR